MAANGTPLLQVKDLHGHYGESHVLHGMTFDVRPGEVVTLLGRNGAGKTTTMRAIMGLLRKRAGSIRYEGTETVGLQPNKIAQLLNEYFSEMTEVIFDYEGTLDKYIGDAIMAIFGAPNLMKDHAYRAVMTGLGMMERLHALNEKRTEDSRFAIRIGINSGRAVAGDIGSIKRMEYTVLGNTVNVASRIESMACKPNQLVVGESTYDLVKDHFVCEGFGPIRLKGISKEARVYRILRQN